MIRVVFKDGTSINIPGGKFASFRDKEVRVVPLESRELVVKDGDNEYRGNDVAVFKASEVKGFVILVGEAPKE